MLQKIIQSKSLGACYCEHEKITKMLPKSYVQVKFLLTYGFKMYVTYYLMVGASGYGNIHLVALSSHLFYSLFWGPLFLR